MTRPHVLCVVLSILSTDVETSDGWKDTLYQKGKGMLKLVKLSTLLIVTLTLLLSITLLLLNRLAPMPAKPKIFEIIAHRGVHQNYLGEGKGLRTDNSYLTDCFASRIETPTHEFLENTVESIAAAFNYGATMVDIDIRYTKDNQLVVFHDETLDCSTDGHGKVSEQTMDYLKTLDIGYGYTSDGQTFPFRGKAIGKIQTLAEVLHQFPDKKFLIDNKNGNNKRVANLLIETLSEFPLDQQRRISLWCQ